MIRAVLYLITITGICLTALVSAALLLAAGVPLDTATLIAATGAAGIAGGLFVWDLLNHCDRGGAL